MQEVFHKSEQYSHFIIKIITLKQKNYLLQRVDFVVILT